LKTDDFPSHAFEVEAPFANVNETDKLPSDEYFQCKKIILQSGESDPITHCELQERIIYVLDGTAQVNISTLS
jgi:hypothetical protein